MYIENIKLHNFRCFEDMEISLNKRLNVLVGNNGAGKTTILNAVKILLGTMFQAYETVASPGINRSDARLEVIEIGNVEDVHSVYPVSLSAKAVIDGEAVAWTRNLNTSKGKTTITDAKPLLDISYQYSKRLQQGDSFLILPVILYYGTGRLFDYHREKKSDVFKSDNRLNGYIDCLDSSANVKLMTRWFKKKTIEKYQRLEAGVEADDALDIVFEAMERVYTAVSGNKNVRTQFNLSREELDIWYTDSKGARNCIPVSRLSDGYRNTISMIADISYRISTLNPNLGKKAVLETPGVILIDELDQHLHPMWQQRIIADLTEIFPNVQFIVTTHAPSVINTVKAENIILLEELGVSDVATETYGMDNNGILKAVMNVSNRPQNVECLFEEFYELMDDEKIEQAENKLKEIESTISENDPTLAACRVKLELSKI